MPILNYETRAGLNGKDDAEYKNRVIALIVGVIIIFAVLIIRLFFLQLIKHGHYARLAINNKEQIIPVPAYRGEVYDARGVKVIENVKSYSMYIVPISLPTNYLKREELFYRVSRLFEIDVEEITNKLRKGRFNKYNPIEIKEHVPFKKVVYLAEHNENYPGVYCESKSVRHYPLNESMCHILGYVRAISPREYTNKRAEGYRHDSIVGKDGVEYYYDKELRGADGYKKRIVDARGGVKREYMPPNGVPLPGKQLFLTIDHKVQRNAELLLRDVRGAAIVSKPATGEIIAMASSPGYDPNIFIGKLENDEYRKLQADPGNPFWNKAIRGLYPASSTFKVNMALAALQSGHITPGKTIYCSGGMLLENRFFKCTGHHGWQNLSRAIQNSCNTYFYTVGYDMGPNTIRKYADMMGFGRSTMIDLPWAKIGVIPSPDWKRTVIKEYWWDGDTLNFSIGQGFLQVTPLEVHNMICAVVNDGIVYRPHVVREIRSSQTGEVLVNNGRKELFTVNIDKQNFHIVKKALRRVVRYGTAKYGAYSPRIAIAGKTGTAENFQGDKSHAWFTCFAPYSTRPDEDTIAVTVFVEHGGGGGRVAAPIATSIIRSMIDGEDPLLVMDSISERRDNIVNRSRTIWIADDLFGDF